MHTAQADFWPVSVCLLWHICQEVCPFNERRATPTSEPAFQPRELVGRTVEALAEMTEEEFREQFRGSPVKRTKWRGLMRNVAAALAVSDDPAAEVALLGALDVQRDDSGVVDEHLPAEFLRSSGALQDAANRRATSSVDMNRRLWPRLGRPAFDALAV
jgi:hypothetical protein